MGHDLTLGRTGLSGAVAFFSSLWALFGGCVLLVVVAINVLSVLGGIVWRPFPGDFELTEIGVAVAVFAFLPYCQISGANVTADIFTARAGRRTIAAFSLLAAIAATLVAGLLLWRMTFGLLDQKNYGYTTAILQVPLWWGYCVILVSLSLLVLTALVSLKEAIHGVAGHAHG